MIERSISAEENLNIRKNTCPLKIVNDEYFPSFQFCLSVIYVISEKSKESIEIHFLGDWRYLDNALREAIVKEHSQSNKKVYVFIKYLTIFYSFIRCSISLFFFFALFVVISFVECYGHMFWNFRINFNLIYCFLSFSVSFVCEKTNMLKFALS